MKKLYETPMVEPGQEDPVRQRLLDVARDKPGELSIVDYQLFSGMAMTREPVTDDARAYIVTKHKEELHEFFRELTLGIKDREVDEFSDVLWTVASLLENTTIGHEDQTIRPQLAVFLHAALDLNDMHDVENFYFEEGGISIPTLAGISNCDLSRYRSVFFGPYRKMPYIRPDTMKPAAMTIDQLQELTAQNLGVMEDAVKLLSDNPSAPMEAKYHVGVAMGFACADTALSLAAVMQRDFGNDVVIETYLHSIRKISERVESGTVDKQLRPDTDKAQT